MRQGLLCYLLAIFFFFSSAVAAKTINIGIITDSDHEQAGALMPLIQAEMQALIAGEFTVNFPRAKQIHADGTAAGIRKVLNQQLNDPEIDLIITLGVLASGQAALIPSLNKPVIAPWVLDQQLQGLPFVDGTSGKHNFTYLTTTRSIPEEVANFHDLVHFKHLAVIINPNWLAALPALKPAIIQMEKELGVTITVTNARNDIHAMLKTLPSNTDAVYVAPIANYNDQKMQSLAAELIKRRLPSFSALGRHDVELGLLAAKGGMPEDKVRFARRLALDVQSILLGDEASGLNVIFADNPKLTLNMQTARAIGFAPPWRFLLDAVLLNQETPAMGEPLTLHEAMQTAIHNNLELQVNELFVAIAQENVDLARANLLPQLIVGITNQQVDANDPQAVIGIAENMTTATVGAEQSIYSDNFWANFRIAQYLEDAEDFKLYGQILDTLELTGNGYLNVLRALAIQDVRRANLAVTDTNLDLARMRERVGYSSRADVLRWESQLALDQQSLLEASSLVFQTQTELNRLLNLPQDEVFNINDEFLGQFMTVINDRTLDTFIGNSYTWKLFQQFAVEETLHNAPELGEIESLTLAKEREELANKRAFYVPSFDFEGALQQDLTASGTGSNFAAEGISKTQWQVSVNATLPILTGGARTAQLAQTGFEAAQLDLQNRNTQELLERRTRDILYKIGESYPAIELSATAANAAQENLSLVSDRYEHGDVDITNLIDAQNTALSAQLDHAQARYIFLNDFIALLRSTGDLMLALDKNSLPHWFERIDYYYQTETAQARR